MSNHYEMDGIDLNIINGGRILSAGHDLHSVWSGQDLSNPPIDFDGPYGDEFMVYGGDMGEENDTNHDAVVAHMIGRQPTELFHGGDTYGSGGYSASEDAYAAFEAYISAGKFFHTHGNHDYDFVPTKNDLNGTLGDQVISAGITSWDYYEMPHTDVDFPTDWKTSSGTAGGFTTGGLSPFGFGETQAASAVGGTDLNHGGDTADKFINYLFRTTVTDTQVTGGMVLEFSFDDALAIYVNGTYVMSWNMIHPITPLSGSIDTIAVDSGTAQNGSTIFDESTDPAYIAILDSDLFDQATNTVAILLKNKDKTSTDCWFNCDAWNYTFPTVTHHGQMGYSHEGPGHGIMAVAPYLPTNCHMFTRSIGDVDYHFISSGRRTNGDFVAGAWRDENSETKYWLEDAIANSTAAFQFVVTHDSPHSHASGKSFSHQEYIYGLSGLNGLIHGDDHQTQVLRQNGGSFLIIGASNFRNSSRSNNGTPAGWDALYFDNTAQNNYYVEMKSTSEYCRIQLIDPTDSSAKYTLTIGA